MRLHRGGCVVCKLVSPSNRNRGPALVLPLGLPKDSTVAAILLFPLLLSNTCFFFFPYSLLTASLLSPSYGFSALSVLLLIPNPISATTVRATDTTAQHTTPATTQRLTSRAIDTSAASAESDRDTATLWAIGVSAEMETEWAMDVSVEARRDMLCSAEQYGEWVV